MHIRKKCKLDGKQDCKKNGHGQTLFPGNILEHLAEELEGMSH